MKPRPEDKKLGSSSDHLPDDEPPQQQLEKDADDSKFAVNQFVWKQDINVKPKMFQVSVDPSTNEHVHILDNGDEEYYIEDITTQQGLWAHSKNLSPSSQQNHFSVAKNQWKNNCEKINEHKESSLTQSTSVATADCDSQNVSTIGNNQQQVSGDSASDASSSVPPSLNSSQLHAATGTRSLRRRKPKKIFSPPLSVVSRKQSTSAQLNTSAPQPNTDTSQLDTSASQPDISTSQLNTSAPELNTNESNPCRKRSPSSVEKPDAQSVKKTRVMFEHPFSNADVAQALQYVNSLSKNSGPSYYAMVNISGSSRSLARYKVALKKLLGNMEEREGQTQKKEGCGISLSRFIDQTQHCLDVSNGVILPGEDPSKIVNNGIQDKKSSSMKIKISKKQDSCNFSVHLNENHITNSSVPTNGNNESVECPEDPSNNDFDPSASSSRELQPVVVSSQEVDSGSANSTEIKTKVNGFVKSSVETSMIANHHNGHQHEDINGGHANSQEDDHAVSTKVSGRKRSAKQASRKEKEMRILSETGTLHLSVSNDKSQVSSDNAKPTANHSTLAEKSKTQEITAKRSHPFWSDSAASSSSQSTECNKKMSDTSIATINARDQFKLSTASHFKSKKSTSNRKKASIRVEKESDSILARILEGKMTYLDVKMILLQLDEVDHLFEVALKYKIETGVLNKSLKDYLFKAKGLNEQASKLEKFQAIKEPLRNILQHYVYCGWNLKIKAISELVNKLFETYENSECPIITDSLLMDFCLANNIWRTPLMFQDCQKILPGFISVMQAELQRLNCSQDALSVCFAHQFEVMPPVDFSHRIFVHVALNCNGYVFNPVLTFVGPNPLKLSNRNNVLALNATSMNTEAPNRYFKMILGYRKGGPVVLVYTGPHFQLPIDAIKSLDKNKNLLIRAPTYGSESEHSQNCGKLLPRLLQRFYYSKTKNLLSSDQVVQRMMNISAQLRTEFFCRETITETYEKQGLFPTDLETAINFNMELAEKEFADKYRLPQLPPDWKGGLRLSEEKNNDSARKLESEPAASVDDSNNITTLKDASSLNDKTTVVTARISKPEDRHHEIPQKIVSNNEMVPSTNKEILPSTTRVVRGSKDLESIGTSNQNVLDEKNKLNASKENVRNRKRDQKVVPKAKNADTSKGIIASNKGQGLRTSNKIKNPTARNFGNILVAKNVKQHATQNQAATMPKCFLYVNKPGVIDEIKKAIDDLDVDKLKEDVQNLTFDDSIDTERPRPVRPGCIRCYVVSMDRDAFENHWRYCTLGDDKLTGDVSVERLKEMKSEATEFDLSTCNRNFWKLTEKVFDDLVKARKNCLKTGKYEIPLRDAWVSTGILAHVCGYDLGRKLNNILSEKLRQPFGTRLNMTVTMEKKDFDEYFNEGVMKEIQALSNRLRILFQAQDYFEKSKLKLPILMGESKIMKSDTISQDTAMPESLLSEAAIDISSTNRKRPSSTPADKAKRPKRRSSADASTEAKESEEELEVMEEESCSDEEDIVKLPIDHNAIFGFSTPRIVADGTNKIQICWDCKKLLKNNERLVKCEGLCSQYYHPECQSLEKVDGSLKCSDCRNNTIKCVHCNEIKYGDDSNEFLLCTKTGCKRYFHPKCKELKASAILEARKRGARAENSKFQNSLMGPQSGCLTHCCYSCYGSDDCSKRLTIAKAWPSDGRRILRCVYCPAAYHNERRCLPMGTKSIAGNHIICPLHIEVDPDKVFHNNVHMDACLVCKDGGELLFCDLCPAAAHAECSVMVEKNMFGEVAKGWFCEDCRNARKPLLGDVVFCKVDHFGWWPATVAPPKHAPKDGYVNKVGEICLKFLGIGDYNWQIQKHCLPFDIGHSFVLHKLEKKSYSKNSSINQRFKDGLEIATRLNKARKREFTSVRSLDVLRVPGQYLWAEEPISYKGTKLPESSYYTNNRCRCLPEKPCKAAGGGCENVLSSFECNPEECPVADLCQNMSLQTRKYPECYVRKFKGKGYGLVANEAISKGTFIGEYTGEVINENEVIRREELKENSMFYYFELENKIFVDANACGNHTRFMNHSCGANCITEKWVVDGYARMAIYAKEDIEAHEELTFSYNNTKGMKSWCRCGAENCVANTNETETEATPSKSATKKTKKTRKAPKDSAKKPSVGEKGYFLDTKFCLLCKVFKKQLFECEKCLRCVCVNCASKHANVPNVEPDQWLCPCHVCSFQCRGKRVESCSFCLTSYCNMHMTHLSGYTPNLRLRICQDHDANTIEKQFATEVAATYNKAHNMRTDDKQVTMELKEYGRLVIYYPSGSKRILQVNHLSPFARADQASTDSLPSVSGVQSKERGKSNESEASKSEKPTPKRVRVAKAGNPKASTSGASNDKPSTSAITEDSSNFKQSTANDKNSTPGGQLKKRGKSNESEASKSEKSTPKRVKVTKAGTPKASTSGASNDKPSTSAVDDDSSDFKQKRKSNSKASTSKRK